MHCVRRRDEFPRPLRQTARPALHRLSSRRRGGPRPSRHLVLRPACLRSAARELHRHRQGRPSGNALVPARPSDHQRVGRPDAPLVERDDVRISDAAAGDAKLSGDAARRDVPHGCRPPDSRRRSTRRSLGHLRMRLRRRRSPWDLSVQGVWIAGPRDEARPRRRARGGALRDRARGDDQPGGSGHELTPADGSRRRRSVRIFRRHRLHVASHRAW